MSYPINQNLKPYQYPQSSTGINSPQLQNIDGDKVKQGIVNNSVLKGVGNDKEESPFSPKVMLMSIPIWAAMCFGMNKFNAACSGNYKDDSLLGKISSWGDRVSERFPYFEKIGNYIETKHNYFIENIVPKSKILTAFFNTPSKPESSMVTPMAKGTVSEVGSDAVKQLEFYFKDGHEVTLNNGDKINATTFKSISANSHDKIKEIIEICEKVDEELKKKPYLKTKTWEIPFSKKIFKESKYLSELIPGLHGVLDKNILFSSIANKLKTFKNPTGTSYLGKNLPRATMRIMEGLTQGTAGGKIAIFFAATFIGDALLKSIKAPKKDKVSTFMENNVYNLGWYLTMPLALKIMHGVGGLQYIGMTPEQVKKYRDKLVEFNSHAHPETGESSFASKEAFESAKKTLKTELKAIKQSGEGSKNILYKPFKFLGTALTVGLENIKPYIKPNANWAEKSISKFWPKTKGIVGGVSRFAIFMFVISPPLAKIFAKSSDFIFGKPAKSVLDEGEEEKNETANMPPQVTIAKPQFNQTAQTQMIQPMHQNNNLGYNQNDQQMTPIKRENLIDMYKPDNSSKNIMSAPQEPVRTYIPSSEGVKVDDSDKNDDKLNNALKKANSADKLASKFVK